MVDVHGKVKHTLQSVLGPKITSKIVVLVEQIPAIVVVRTTSLIRNFSRRVKQVP
jgi:hypothetical protein